MYETNRSQSDWDRFRALELKRHQEYFLPAYKNLGMEILKDIGNDTKTNTYDVLVRWKGNIYKVEEKARDAEYNDLLVEVMQCLKTGRLGWIYNNDDLLFYASWENPKTTLPSSAYLIDFKKLREFVFENFDRLPSAVSQEGYGYTYNKKVAWLDLEYLKIAQKVEYQDTDEIV